MIECYHPEIHFKDEVFNLNGKKVGAMWHMLCERGKDLEISFKANELPRSKLRGIFCFFE